MLVGASAPPESQPRTTSATTGGRPAVSQYQVPGGSTLVAVDHEPAIEPPCAAGWVVELGLHPRHRAEGDEREDGDAACRPTAPAAGRRPPGDPPRRDREGDQGDRGTAAGSTGIGGARRGRRRPERDDQPPNARTAACGGTLRGVRDGWVTAPRRPIRTTTTLWKTRSTPRAEASQVSVRARASAASPRRRRRRRRQHVGDRPTEVRGGTARPVRPATTEQRWPLMSVATAGVPHAAASVSESPHPSASEALATTHARRYSSRSWPRHVAEQLTHPPASWSPIHAQVGAQRPVADDPHPQHRARGPRRRAPRRAAARSA